MLFLQYWGKLKEVAHLLWSEGHSGFYNPDNVHVVRNIKSVTPQFILVVAFHQRFGRLVEPLMHFLRLAFKKTFLLTELMTLDLFKAIKRRIFNNFLHSSLHLLSYIFFKKN